MAAPKKLKQEQKFKNVQLRKIQPDDRAFLHQVYADSRADEMALVNWSAQEKDNFIRMQFEAQHQHYMQHFPDARYCVVQVGLQTIGRLYANRTPEEIRIIDIAILKPFQKNGYGGYLLKSILEEAESEDKKVAIHVEQRNPAMHFYKKLGFRQVRDEGVYKYMEWRPV